MAEANASQAVERRFVRNHGNELRVVDTVWGHFAGGPGTSPDDIATLDAALKELLAS